MPEDDNFLNVDLMENLHDDPYGTTMYVIRNLLRVAMSPELAGTMNDTEHTNLARINEVFAAIDRR